MVRQTTCGRCTVCKPGSSAASAVCGAVPPAEAADDGDQSAIPGGCSKEIADVLPPSSVVDEGGGSNQLNSQTPFDNKIIKVMTYNVWLREDLELSRRMEALGDLIHHHNPDLICFQEITPKIYHLLQRSGWWQEYKCSLSDKIDMYMKRRYFCMQMSKLHVNSFESIPFGNSVMKRELCKADTNVGSTTKLVLATSHLESGRDQIYRKERAAQANESVRILDSFRNVIFCGDMNWAEGDGQFPLPDGWVDAWDELKPDEDGWMYDTEANGMISGGRRLQGRLDRFVCKLPDFKIRDIEMIGKEAIPGLSYSIEKKLCKGIRKLELPVLPSDHFGLVLSIAHAAPSGTSEFVAQKKVSNDDASRKKKTVLHYFSTLFCGRAQ